MRSIRSRNEKTLKYQRKHGDAFVKTAWKSVLKSVTSTLLLRQLNNGISIDYDTEKHWAFNALKIAASNILIAEVIKAFPGSWE